MRNIHIWRENIIFEVQQKEYDSETNIIQNIILNWMWNPNNDITVKWWYSNYYLNFHEDRMRNSFVWIRLFGATLKLMTT